jgi:hypothetical protein
MIGGIDIRIPTRAGPLSAEVAVRAIRQKWPAARFEDGLTGDRYDEFWQVPFCEIEELFVYRDSRAADLWDAEGAVPEAYNSMIHVIAGEGLLTLVIDEEDGEMNSILAAVRSALADGILYIPVPLEAA